MKRQKYGWLQDGLFLTLSILFMAEAQALRLEQLSVKYAKQEQPLCRLMGQAVSTVRLTAANLVLTNCGRRHE